MAAAPRCAGAVTPWKQEVKDSDVNAAHGDFPLIHFWVQRCRASFQRATRGAGCVCGGGLFAACGFPTMQSLFLLPGGLSYVLPAAATLWHSLGSAAVWEHIGQAIGGMYL